MQCRDLLLLVLLSFSAAGAQTQYVIPNASSSASQSAHENSSKAACPWLTQGSAATVLGGDISVTARVSDAGEGFCRFSRQQGSDFLEILVSRASLPRCPSGSTELKGIGNEAKSCSHPGSRGESVEMVSSRVRDLYFSVMFTSRGLKSGMKSPDAHDDALEQIAEQVAGNLY
jgi:hypothetical protein